MQIKLATILVADQDHALRFYTEKLGFTKKTDIRMGDFRWLTVISPEGIAGVELVLQPLAFPPARIYQKALLDAGMPAASFITTDVAAEHRALAGRGVVFRGPPTSKGPIMSTLFEDSCGNLIHLVQPLGHPPA